MIRETGDSSNKMTFEITDEEKGQRIDKYLSEHLKELTRSHIQKLIKDEFVAVNEKLVKANYKLRVHDLLTVLIPEAEEADILAEDIPLSVLYEDRDVILINKPKGMVVHPAHGHTSGTLVNALLYHCKDELSGINGIQRPGIVHRIDMDTTGVLIVCKNDMAHNHLAEQLKNHTVNRRYRAIVYGNLKEDEGTIDAPIGRHPVDRKRMAVTERGGKHAVTHWTVLERFGNYTYIECRLETGRTHQIRVHMASIHHPLLGDNVYGARKSPFSLDGQALHAMTLGFEHPHSGEYIEVSAPLPDYFERILNRLRNC